VQFDLFSSKCEQFYSVVGTGNSYRIKKTAKRQEIHQNKP